LACIFTVIVILIHAVQDGTPKVGEGENTVSSSCNESQSADKANEATVPVKELGEAVQSTVAKFQDLITEKYNQDISAVKRKQWVRKTFDLRCSENILNAEPSLKYWFLKFLVLQL